MASFILSAKIPHLFQFVSVARWQNEYHINLIDYHLLDLTPKIHYYFQVCLHSPGLQALISFFHKSTICLWNSVPHWTILFGNLADRTLEVYNVKNGHHLKSALSPGLNLKVFVFKAVSDEFEIKILICTDI